MKRSKKKSDKLTRLYGFMALRLDRLNTNYMVFAILFVFVLLFYGNTLWNGFVHDDIGQVVRNEYVHSLEGLPNVVTGCIWKFELGDCTTYYRPIQSLSYLLTYQISQSPWIFHLVNLVYFALTGFFVFVLANLLTKDRLFAFIAVLLFLVHPINSETVNWVSAIPELTFAFFSLLSLIWYISYRQSLKVPKRSPKRKQIARSLRVKDIFHMLQVHRKLLLAALFYLLALFSKEPAVLLPVVFVFFDVFFFATPLKRLFSRMHMAAYTAFGAVFALYFSLRLAVLGGLGQGGDYYGVFSVLERTYGFVTLFGQYLSKLIFPYPLVFFYPYEKSTDFLSLQFLGSLLLLLLFVGAMIFFLRKRQTLFGFALFWILLFLLPVLVALQSVGENVFSERYLFLSSIGYVFLLAALVTWMIRYKKTWVQKSAFLLLGIVFVGSWFVVFQRNTLWRDDFSLYAATIEQNPNAHAIQRNYAVELGEQGRHEEAIAQLHTILESNPEWRDIGKVYNNLGDAYRSLGDTEQAFFYYHEFLRVSGDISFKPYNNLGALYFERGEYLNSLVFTCKATELNPRAQEPQFNLRRLVLLFDSIQEDNLALLHQDIVNGEVFQKSDETRVVNTGLSCNADRCLFAFASGFRPGEVVFPFLILGSTEADRIIRGQNPSFDAQTGAIILTTSSQHESEPITFIFPTCEGIYYEAITAVQP